MVGGVAAIDERILQDMLDASTVESLMEAFGRVCGVGAGIFTPTGKRIGEPAHHSSYCRLIYSTREGKAACDQCDRDKIEALIRGDKETSRVYPCHARLIDFCEPICCRVRGQERFIGVFFAGQVLYDAPLKKRTISEIRKVADRYKIDPDELLARYMEAPKLPKELIDDISSWMKEFAKLIGLLVERKAATHSLWLDVINAGDDQDRIVQAIQRNLGQPAVSIFLRRDDAPSGYEDSIFLVATTDRELATRILIPLGAVERPDAIADAIAYRRGEGLTGWVYETGQVLHVVDVWDETCYPQDPHPPDWERKIVEIANVNDIKAFLGVPIYADDSDNTIGVMRAVRLKDEPGFREDEVELLKGVSSVVAGVISKAKLYREHTEKSRALDQTHQLLSTLAEPGVNLKKITSNIAERLGQQHVQRGDWSAVYVLQHLPEGEFQISAAYPPDLPGEHEGFRFPETEGIAGEMLRTGKSFAARDCKETGVSPARPWRSVVAAPILDHGKMWGAVALCGNSSSILQADVNTAWPEVIRCAEHISIVCRLTELFEAKDTETLAKSRLLSLGLVAHDIARPLVEVKFALDRLCSRTPQGDNLATLEGMRDKIVEALDWAGVCENLSTFVRMCQNNPGTAVAEFRQADSTVGNISLSAVAKRALTSVRSQAGKYQAKVKSSLEAETLAVGYEEVLYHALRNLLENAIVRGSRKKEGEYIEGVEVLFSTVSLSEGTTTRIIVEDNGVGIEPKKLEAIRATYKNPTLLWDPSQPAPGFGTMVVGFSVALHQGEVEITSETGQGTRVIITIPSFERKGELLE